MRKLLIITALLSVSFVTKGEIKTRKEGKTLIVEFFYPKSSELFDEQITIDYISKDISDAFAQAQEQKCNTMLFCDNKNNFFRIFKGKEQIVAKEEATNAIIKAIEEMDEWEDVPGKIIGKKTVKSSGAKYRSETYLNGKLKDTYESDWSAGWFAPETSTYQSGSDIFVTKTFYVPPKTETIYERAPGERQLKESGVKVFAKQVYRSSD